MSAPALTHPHATGTIRRATIRCACGRFLCEAGSTTAVTLSSAPPPPAAFRLPCPKCGTNYHIRPSA